MDYAVTVGIPIYRAEPYIEATLESALGQSFASIDFLLIDDCGNDGTMAVVKRFQREHPRGNCIRILRNEKHLGVGPTRNRIIDEARGQYLYFLDSDDIIEKNTIELLYEKARHCKAETVYGSYERIDNVHGGPVETYVYPSLELFGEDVVATYAFRNYGKFQTSVCNCLIDLEFLRLAGVRFNNAIFWEDMAFTYELVTKVQRAVLLPHITYHYLCRPGSLSNYQDREELQKEEILRNVSTIDELKSRCGLFIEKSYLPYYCYNMEMNSFYIVCHILKYRQRIVPSVLDKELVQMLHFPLPVKYVFTMRYQRMQNFLLWLLSHLPTIFCLSIVRLLGKYKGVL